MRLRSRSAPRRSKAGCRSRMDCMRLRVLHTRAHIRASAGWIACACAFYTHAHIMAFTLHNHVALVTGSSTGLGKAIAHTLGKQGAKVGLNYFNNQERAEKTLAEFRRDGIEVHMVRCDATTQEGVDLLYSEAEARLG